MLKSSPCKHILKVKKQLWLRTHGRTALLTLSLLELLIAARNKLGLSWAKLSSAVAKISLVFIGWVYREKIFWLFRLRLTFWHQLKKTNTCLVQSSIVLI